MNSFLGAEGLVANTIKNGYNVERLTGYFAGRGSSQNPRIRARGCSWFLDDDGYLNRNVQKAQWNHHTVRGVTSLCATKYFAQQQRQGGVTCTFEMEFFLALNKNNSNWTQGYGLHVRQFVSILNRRGRAETPSVIQIKLRACNY